MEVLIIFIIILNIAITCIIRKLLSTERFTSRDKDRNVKTIGLFNLAKFPIILITSIFITYYITQKTHNVSLVLKLFPVYTTYILINIDAMIMFRPIKKIRSLEIDLITYMKGILVENFMVFIPWCLVVLVHDLIPYQSKDTYFFIFYFIIWGIYIIVQPYITRFVLNAKKISLNEIINNGECFKSNLGNSFSLFQYNGKKRKSANAFVEGYLNKYNVYVSDYLIENVMEDEMEAILLHEIGHIKKHHILIRNMIIMGLTPLLYVVGIIMDNINEFFNIEINIGLGITFMFSIIIGYCVFMYLYICRIQEYQADVYVVQQGIDISQMCNALEKLAKLNDIMKNSSKVEQSLSTHPSIEKRINKLVNRKEE